MLPCKTIDAEKAAERIAGLARQARNDCNATIAVCDSGTLPLHDLVASLMQRTRNIKAEWDINAAIDGVGAALEARYPSKTFVGDTEIAAFGIQLQTLIDHIRTEIPLAASRWISTLEFDVDGGLVQRTTTNAPSIAGLKAELEAVVNLCDLT